MASIALKQVSFAAAPPAKRSSSQSSSSPYIGCGGFALPPQPVTMDLNVMMSEGVILPLHANRVATALWTKSGSPTELLSAVLDSPGFIDIVFSHQEFAYRLWLPISHISHLAVLSSSLILSLTRPPYCYYHPLSSLHENWIPCLDITGYKTYQHTPSLILGLTEHSPSIVDHPLLQQRFMPLYPSSGSLSMKRGIVMQLPKPLESSASAAGRGRGRVGVERD